MKYVESKVRRYNKRVQADRWLLEVRTRVRKGFKVAIVSIASDTIIDRLSKGGSGFSYEAKREK